MDAFEENGAPRTIVEEPLTWAESYPIEWWEPRVDLAELAKLRWIEKWARKDLAHHFGRTEGAIQSYFQKLKRRRFQIPGLTEGDRSLLLAAAR